MSDNKVHLRHLMLYYFRKGKNATQTTKKLCKAYGDGVVNERTVQKWFTRFRSGDINVEDKKHTGRPIEVNDEEIAKLINKNPRHTTREIAENLKISQTTVSLHLQRLGYVNTNGIWGLKLVNENISKGPTAQIEFDNEKNENTIQTNKS